MDPNKPVELRLRAAVESSPSGLLMADADGTIVLVNREIERLFGYSREELLGRPVEMLVPERMRSPHAGFRRGFLADPSVRMMGAGRELFGLRKDGTETPIEIGLTPIATEEGMFVISAIVDISARRQAETERLRLEDQLRQAQKLEAIGRLAGGIAHDFNNILGVILGYTELAAEQPASESQKSHLEQVLQAVVRGKEMIERILRFSRRKELEARPLDLARSVTEASRLLRATLPAAVELRMHTAPDLPPVLADDTSINQVVMNLATNAAQAMPAGGRLDIGLDLFFARDSFVRSHLGLREGYYVRLAVKDSGGGMDEATRARAFDPFFTTKPIGSGSGLGLAMVHGIIANFGGTAWIESAPGAGTTVFCILPVAAEAIPDPIDLPQPVRLGSNERILYIDDEQELATLGQRRLTPLKYRIEIASDPAQALAVLETSPAAFDLVITDFSMPKMNGVELAESVHALRSDLPVILLTGYMEDFPAEYLAAAGILKVLKKPVTTAMLAEAIHSVLHPV